MDNQHKKIKGYRDLTQDEIDAMNKVKEKGEELRLLINDLRAFGAATGGHAVDGRWASIGETHLQQGIMALVRSVAKPDSF